MRWTSCSRTVAGDSAPARSRTPSRKRSASANSSSGVSGICWRRTMSSCGEVEARVGPEQELVERGLAVDQADLRRGDLALVEPDLAAAEAADQRQDARCGRARESARTSV